MKSDTIRKIGTGDIVKIGNKYERFWVKLMKKTKNGYKAKLMNTLVCRPYYKNGHMINIRDSRIMYAYKK